MNGRQGGAVQSRRDVDIENRIGDQIACPETLEVVLSPGGIILEIRPDPFQSPLIGSFCLHKGLVGTLCVPEGCFGQRKRCRTQKGPQGRGHGRRSHP
jgi:hypothetical protein